MSLFALPCLTQCQLQIGSIYSIMHTAVFQRSCLKADDYRPQLGKMSEEKTQKEIRDTGRSQETLKLPNSLLTGSARGKACGQALAGSLGPRGTARAPTILHILRDMLGGGHRRR